ncbi:MAG: hypothetical protein ACR2IE_10645 [Candidatus Sumerlaeaceae bacterium]
MIRIQFFSFLVLLVFAAQQNVSALPGDVILKIDNPQPGLLDQFGAEVAVTSKDLVIGAPYDSNSTVGGGSVSIYDAKLLSFRQLINRTGLDTFTSFGAALAIAGRSVVIGEPQGDFSLIDSGYGYLVSLKIINYQRTFVNPALSAQDYFGTDVAARKKLYALGAPGDDTVTSNAGTVYVFDQKTSLPVSILFPASISQNQEFGSALAFLSGNVIAVGAPGQIAPAGANAGAAYVYDARTRQYFGLILEPGRRPGARFGAALAASKRLLAVGAPGELTSGAVYLYNLSTGAAPVRFDNPSPDTGDLFGTSVAFVGKSYLLVGAPGDDFGGVDAGAAYLFDISTGAVVLTIVNPESTPGDRFGHVVASDGKRLFIGSPGNVVSGILSAGSVFVIEGP